MNDPYSKIIKKICLFATQKNDYLIFDTTKVTNPITNTHCHDCSKILIMFRSKFWLPVAIILGFIDWLPLGSLGIVSIYYPSREIHICLSQTTLLGVPWGIVSTSQIWYLLLQGIMSGNNKHQPVPWFLLVQDSLIHLSHMCLPKVVRNLPPLLSCQMTPIVARMP